MLVHRNDLVDIDILGRLLKPISNLLGVRLFLINFNLAVNAVQIVPILHLVELHRTFGRVNACGFCLVEAVRTVFEYKQVVTTLIYDFRTSLGISLELQSFDPYIFGKEFAFVRVSVHVKPFLVHLSVRAVVQSEVSSCLLAVEVVEVGSTTLEFIFLCFVLAVLDYLRPREVTNQMV